VQEKSPETAFLIGRPHPRAMRTSDPIEGALAPAQ
jgi:hypothetical protein